MTSVSPVNGKTSIPPAASPLAGPPPIAVGNNATAVNGAVSGPGSGPGPGPGAGSGPGSGLGPALTSGEHNRKSSVTISAAGATGYRPNGGPVAGSSSRSSTIRFGALDAAGSPAASYNVPQSNHQSSSSLSVGAPQNPRITSPQTSPSPIPQPAASGGRPPTGLQTHSNPMSFGSWGSEPNETHTQRHMRPSAPQGPLSSGPHSSHLRRESSQSVQSDISSSNVPAGPGRGGYSGRGSRSYNGGYSHHHHHHHPNNHHNHPPPQHHQQHHPPPHHQQQAPFSGQPGFRGSPNVARAGPMMHPPFAGHGGPMRHFQDGAHRQTRSPAPHPVTPQMQPVPMANTPSQSSHYGPYPPNVGAPQVNPSPSLAHRRLDTSPRPAVVGPGVGPGPGPGHGHGHGHGPMPNHAASTVSAPNLSPENGFMEQYLMMRNLQAAPYGVPQHFDPAYAPLQPQIFYPGMYMGPPQGSPRQHYQSLSVTGPPPYVPDHYGHPQPHHPQPQPMSRTSSAAMSEQRPASSIGHAPTPSITPANPHHQHHQPPLVGKTSPAPPSAAAKGFKIPERKGPSVVIKDPTSGAVKTFDTTPPGPPMIVTSDPSSKLTSTSTPARTPPPRSRSESKAAAKTDEEKKSDMKDAIAKKIEADKAEERRQKETEDREKQEAAEREAKEIERRQREENEAEEKKKKKKREEEEEEKKKKEEEEEKEQSRRVAQEKEEVARAEREAAEEEARRSREEAAQREKKEAEAKAKVDAEEKAAREANEAKEAAERAEEEAAAERIRKEQEAQATQRKREEGEEKEAEKEKGRKAEETASANPEAAPGAEGAKGESVAADTAREAPPASTAADSDAVGTSEPERERSGPSPAPSDGPARKAVGSGASTPANDEVMGPPPKPIAAGKAHKPPQLNLAPIKTGSIEPPQPSAALQSLKTAKFIDRLSDVSYPQKIASPNPALNPANTKGRFKYNRDFLMQFQPVFVEKPSIDWDNRLKETVGGGSGAGGGGGDSARPQSARTTSMGPRTASGRSGLPAAFPMGGGGMGSFGQTGRTLPPGTTSEQRLAMSDANMRRPPMNNPLSQYARPSGFAMPGAPPMNRTNSFSGMQSANAVPPSPRPGPRSTRVNSRRQNTSTKAEEQAAKSMPLTASLDVKPLLPSSTGWKPRSLAGAASATGAAGPPPGASSSNHMEPDMVQRKVKAALNKMTPEKFEKIADQILEIAAQSKDETDGRTLRQVIQLTFEKATDEAHWASMYAKFCRRMLESVSPEIRDENIKDKSGNVITGGGLFRKYLLNRCQEEFERGWKVNLPPRPEGDSEEAVMLSDEYYVAAAAKRRGLGLVQFIGELYKLNMLTERIMHECVKKLVDYEGVPDEAEVESLCKLLRTIGINLDQTDKGKPLMDVYFQRIKVMIDTPDLPSRLKFMLMDIVDTRRTGWLVKERNKGPQTIQEIREAAMREQAEKDAERSRQQNQRHHGGGGRMHGGRGDARNYSGGGNQMGMMPPPDVQRNTVGMDDLRKLSRQAGSRQSNQGTTFGPALTFSSRSNSGRKPLGPGASLRAGGEESGASSRTGTPPTQKEKEPSTSANTYGLLAGLDNSDDHGNTASPPSTAPSPPTNKSRLAASTIDERSRGSNSKANDKGRDRSRADGNSEPST